MYVCGAVNQRYQQSLEISSIIKVLIILLILNIVIIYKYIELINT